MTLSTTDVAGGDAPRDIEKRSGFLCGCGTSERSTAVCMMLVGAEAAQQAPPSSRPSPGRRVRRIHQKLNKQSGGYRSLCTIGGVDIKVLPYTGCVTERG